MEISICPRLESLFYVSGKGTVSELVFSVYVLLQPVDETVPFVLWMVCVQSVKEI